MKRASVQLEHSRTVTAHKAYLPKSVHVSRGIVTLMWLHLALAAVHVGLGSSWYLIIIFTGISIFGLSKIFQDQLWPSDFFLIGISFYSAGAAILFKALLGQPLQSNLLHPIYSGTAVLLGFIAVSVGCGLAKSIQKKNSLGRLRFESLPVKNPKFYILLILAGMTFFILHIALRPRVIEGLVVSGGFGGFGSFYFVLLLGIACAADTYGHTRSTASRLTLTLSLLLMICASIIANTKKESLDVLLLFALMLLSYRVRLRLSTIIFGATLVFILFFYISPLIHLMRENFVSMSMMERFTELWRLAAEHNYNFFLISEAEQRYLSSFTTSYAEYASYIFPQKLGLDRFFLILPVDQVMRGMLNGHYISLMTLLDQSVQNILPSFLIEKDPFAGADLIAWEYGIRGAGSIGRPVIGLYASLLAVGGFAALFVGSIALPFIVFSICNFLFGTFRGNALCLFFVVMMTPQMEKELDALLTFLVRDLSIVILFISSIRLVSRLVVRRQA